MTVEQLRERIIEHLRDRERPISIGPGTRIIDLEKFAESQAKNALGKSEFVAHGARERLKLLGIEVED